MKKQFLMCLLSAVIGACPARGQSTFQNLDFEAAQLLFSAPGKIASSNAIPGWAAYAGPIRQHELFYNSGGGFRYAAVELVGTNSLTIQGGFSVLLSGLDPFTQGVGAISQFGFVPPDAKTLFFDVRTLTRGPIVVSINGQNLPYASVTQNLDVTLYAADISDFSGQGTTLSFFAGVNGASVLDNVRFSPQPIPEPSMGMLGFVGGLVLVLRWRSANRRQSGS